MSKRGKEVKKEREGRIGGRRICMGWENEREVGEEGGI